MKIAITSGNTTGNTAIAAKLPRPGIPFQVYSPRMQRLNIFSGIPGNVNVAGAINTASRKNHTPAEDIIIETNLGYDHPHHYRQHVQVKTFHPITANASVSARVANAWSTSSRQNTETASTPSADWQVFPLPPATGAFRHRDHVPFYGGSLTAQLRPACRRRLKRQVLPESTPAAPPPKYSARLSAFTLIELLVVIGMLGALATLLLPSLAAIRTEAFDPIVHTEMQEIRLAFQRFYHDVMPSDKQLDLFRQFGLAPLMQSSLKGATDFAFTGWDPDKCRGWRGPYLEIEGTRVMSPPHDISNGQNEAGPNPDGNEVTIPVILDPYSGTEQDARFYRVLCRQDKNGTWIAKDLALVFVGIEKSNPYLNNQFDDTLLDSSPHNDDEDNTYHQWEEKYIVSDDDDTDSEIIKKLILDCE